MSIKKKRSQDLNKRAASTVAFATGQEEEKVEEVAEPTEEERHDAAVTLGRKGGQSRAKNLSPEKRSEIAKKAAQTRWAKKK